MEQKGFHRKLTATLSADVAGYSRLIQDDEAATLVTYNQIFSYLIHQDRRWVVSSRGDNVLWQFTLNKTPPPPEKVDLKKMVFASLDKTSIAVPSFQNLTGDDNKEIRQ